MNRKEKREWRYSWFVYILVTLLCFIFGILPQFANAQVYAYPNLGGCINDANNYTPSGYIAKYADENSILDARIPAIGGSLGKNCLKGEVLSYGVLMDMTENGLVHPDYSCYHPYGPLGLQLDAHTPIQPYLQIPFTHQGASWVLIPKADVEKSKPLKVRGAKLTSCGVELLKIVDIEPLPDFTANLVKYFLQSGYQMVHSE